MGLLVTRLSQHVQNALEFGGTAWDRSRSLESRRGWRGSAITMLVADCKSAA
jgi:hypothetical protein